MKTIITNTTPAATHRDMPLPDPSKGVLAEMTHDGILEVTFDRPGSSANLLDSGTLQTLEKIIDDAKEAAPRGVIFQSAKPSVFIVGADLNELASGEGRGELIDAGQRVFNKIAALRCVTVAAIHGACAGGGFELSLACDHRVASFDRSTRIGLPETSLGIIPGWGGCTRLPRLVGAKRALDIILRAELFPAAKALKLGMVDALAHHERIGIRARQFIETGKARHHSAVWSLIGPMAAPVVRRIANHKAGGHYPALPAAADVVMHAPSRSIPHSLAAEKEAVLSLAETDACKNLIRLFFLQEQSKRRKTPLAKPVHRAAVTGAGVMGAGIAQWFAARGIPVVLSDISADRLAHGLKHAGGLFSDATRRGLMSAADARAGLDRICPAETAVPLDSVDLAVEAAVEKMDIKKQILADLERRVTEHAVIATNTSALSITEMASLLRHPERVVGMHFFNPVHRMKLVEVVRPDGTDDDAADTAIAFVQRMGKLPVVVRDSPGFLVNRILLPYLLEAGWLFEAGARAETLDVAMTEFGMPMGPMRLLDEVGMDVAADVAQTLCAAFPERMWMPGFFSGMLGMQLTGRKGGAGFYHYKNGREDGMNERAEQFQESSKMAETGIAELQKRMVLMMINEAAQCLEERIVETLDEVDFAMIMGTGFAPFRGGPLRFADTVGAATIVSEMDRLHEAGNTRFSVCERLRDMAQHGAKFYETAS